ncbi:hypothetical protein MPTK1_8g07350 [Marchantia polymorpha subsp. ruderalis]|uniref:Uncharacterized protein n=1 Tax=Marchantia polymorpha TaxID=3197 RepID=A0A2R6XI99_MARPO|nr:hypothetical protein MARPO_0013s0058 [Marchantia polymorpha]BBN19019.1 hypothetical protein Mp_8g07350 [Marchantia polymorpha subsp. ruderalis]|eukprot:PTQ45827.1 hypothetical protein MARPO_0013s0058 [Marchantia polymorpha]
MEPQGKKSAIEHIHKDDRNIKNILISRKALRPSALRASLRFLLDLVQRLFQCVDSSLARQSQASGFQELARQHSLMGLSEVTL